MSLANLANYSSHLKNCVRLNISTTSVPFNKFNLKISYHLYKEGFLSSLKKGSLNGPDKVPVEVTSDNIATRRLWLGLKYRNNNAIIKHFEMISKPSRKVNLSDVEIKALSSGINVRFIEGLQPGEIILVKVGDEIMEIQEAAKKGVHGMVLCRIR
ncbi:37S ribosomal protein S8, mitochondrial [[Candida] jaroonii]|uniref:37S ribosomal protein S8, mitochondrial n=1 Tax=[Candida] jaroonii TaxID=467808 RepID=A0ACA9Y7U3_9ASCO|nr:37S ribosomal protein S8, mitochondrial [[Candida] jaroonii]